MYQNLDTLRNTTVHVYYKFLEMIECYHTTTVILSHKKIG